MKKRKLADFISSFYITFVVIICLVGGILSAAAAYENTLKIGFGKEQTAFEITENGIRIFDLKILETKQDVMKI